MPSTQESRDRKQFKKDEAIRLGISAHDLEWKNGHLRFKGTGERVPGVPAVAKKPKPKAESLGEQGQVIGVCGGSSAVALVWSGRDDFISPGTFLSTEICAQGGIWSALSDILFRTS